MNLQVFRYGLAIVGVVAAMGLRLSIESWLGSGLPPYITFYPTVMAVGILAGLGPGILATAMSALIADYWILQPIGHLSIASPIDRIGEVIFLFMGLLMSLLAELYRRNRDKAAAYDHEMMLQSKKAALRESDERFHVMANAMPQLGWIARPDGYINWYNDRWYEYTGTTPEQMEGWGWQIVHDTVELPKVLDRWKTSIATGNPFEMTFPLRGADGKFRQFLTRVFPLKNTDGSVAQWFGTNTDVEEQARAEKLLRESETRYRSLVEQAPDGIFIADLRGHYKDVNSAGCKMLRYSHDEVLNLTLADVIDPAEIPRIGPEMARLAGGELVVSEWQFLRKDGSTFLGEVRGRQLTNGNLQGILIDITERKKAELLLEESEKQHRTLFENMLDGYSHCKMLYANNVPHDFIYLNVNSALEEQTGLSNIVGKKVSEVIPGIRESNPELIEIFGRVILTGQPEKFEMHLESLGGWFSIAVYSTKKEYFVALFDDITERKRTEQELIFMNNQLKHEVTNRTHDLSSLAAHIQKIAETERAKVARDLHDEMGSIMTALHLEVGRLQRKASDPDLASDLTVIRELISKAVQSKRNIINQLYPTVLDDSGFAHAVNLMVKEYRQHSGIDVEIVMQKEDIIMAADYALAAYRITQECLTNIAKHAEASMVQIKAAVWNGFLDLTIKDNGKGMPCEISVNRHGIFGMKERARHFGGSMEIGSDEGGGTTAHLFLPLSVAKPAIKKRVLVADDHSIVRNALRQLLERETDDFSVEGEANDGKDAVHMAIDEEWDLMLLDITMPKKNGIKVLEEVKAVKPELPIIMLSSHSKNEYGELAISKGAADYVEKGDTDKLVEVMRRVLIPN